MLFYGLVSWETQSVVEFYPSREEAEAERADAVADEPGWESVLGVVAIDFSGESAVVLPRWRAR
jgi:hypothetical protein